MPLLFIFIPKLPSLSITLNRSSFAHFSASSQTTTPLPILALPTLLAAGDSFPDPRRPHGANFTHYSLSDYRTLNQNRYSGDNGITRLHLERATLRLSSATPPRLKGIAAAPEGVAAHRISEMLNSTACLQLSEMFAAIIFFHVSEYFLAIKIHGSENVTLRSLLISKSYLIAMITSVLEYLLEFYFFPDLKQHWWISNIGLTLVLAGELIRKLAIITAGQSFTHLIKVRHEESHKLVTHGVYSYVRHPGYCGFFVWSIGTQIMLVNPVCVVVFAVVVWNFFAQRIPYEEYYLRSFFGDEYSEYAKRVPSGIPFVE